MEEEKIRAMSDALDDLIKRMIEIEHRVGHLEKKSEGTGTGLITEGLGTGTLVTKGLGKIRRKDSKSK